MIVYSYATWKVAVGAKYTWGDNTFYSEEARLEAVKRKFSNREYGFRGDSPVFLVCRTEDGQVLSIEEYKEDQKQVIKPEEEKIDNSTFEALKCGHPRSDRTTLIMGSGSSISCMARDYPTHGPATIDQQKIRNEYTRAKLAEEIEKKRRFATSVGWNPFDLDLED